MNIRDSLLSRIFLFPPLTAAAIEKERKKQAEDKRLSC